MKIGLKYGLGIAVAVMAWTLIAHALVSNPQSNVHNLGAFAYFNVVQFVGIYLGLRALEREKGEKLIFKEGVKQGVAISFVYAVTTALFFACVLLIVGTKWMAAEALTPDTPMWIVAVKAFAGLTIMSMIFGLVYSTLISFVLARKLSSDE